MLSNYPRFYIYIHTYKYVIYTVKITVSKKQDAINRQDEYHYYVSVNSEFSSFRSRRKLSSLRSARAYRRRLYFTTVLSRLITAPRRRTVLLFQRVAKSDLISSIRLDSSQYLRGRNEFSFSRGAKSMFCPKIQKGGASLSIRFENHPFKYKTE